MNRLIILDTETTGLDFKTGHRIIEIGCVEIVNRKFTGNEYHTYINPDRYSDEGALRVHGLTAEFLSDKPRFSEIYEDFISFIKDSELLIHNAEFDIGFLDNEIKLVSKDLNSIEKEVLKVTDTLQIAREKHPGQRNSLDALVNRYEINGYDRELHGAEALLLHELFEAGQAFLVGLTRHAGGVDRKSAAIGAAQQAPDRFFAVVPEHVPEGDVDGGEGALNDGAHKVRGAVEPLVVVLDCGGIFAD